MRNLACLLAFALAPPAAGAGLFVAGQQSEAVLEFDLPSGSFTRVFAATIHDGFRNPGGIALRPTDGALFVSSRGTGEIWRYDTATGAVATPAVKTGLISPNGIDFAASGASLYFADANDSSSATADAVKQLDVATGAVTTVGSTVNAEFADVAVNGCEVNGCDVFAVDTDGSRVIHFLAGGSVATAIGSGLSHPSDLAFRSTTRLLIADTGTDRVLEYVNTGGSWIFDRVVLPASSGVQDPCALAIAPSGALTVSGCASNDVVLVDLTTLAVTSLIAPGAGGLASPKDVAWSGSTLLVANPITNAVVYYDAAGAPTGVLARGVTPALDGGFAFSADAARLAVASSAGDVVIEYDADTGLPLRSFGGACSGWFPNDVAYGADGDLFVSCFGTNGVNRIDYTTGAVATFVLGGSGGLFAPRSIGFGPNGNLFASSASGEVLEYNGVSGSFVRVFVDASGNGGGAIDPYGFRFHGGALYVTSFYTDAVTVYDAACGPVACGAFLSTLIATGSGGLDGPTALDFGPNNDVFVASNGNDSVLRYHATTGAFLGISVPAGANGLNAPVDLAVRGLPEPSSPLGLASGALLLAGLRRRQPGLAA